LSFIRNLEFTVEDRDSFAYAVADEAQGPSPSASKVLASMLKPMDPRMKALQKLDPGVDDPIAHDV